MALGDVAGTLEAVAAILGDLEEDALAVPATALGDALGAAM